MRHPAASLLTLAALGAAVTCSLAAAPATPAPAAAATPAPAATQTALLGPSGTVETKEQKDARMKWWREARFGMFIHWGLYCVPAGVYKGQNIGGIGEWIMNNASIPAAEYAKYAEQFNPNKFNADDFVAVAKAAGMKYIVITAKHHDGFAMFKSADPFNIVDATPFKRDVIKELAVATRKAGLRFGTYYSQTQDWHHPGGYANAPNNRSRPAGTHWDPAAQDGSFDDYINKIAIPQVKELISNIQPDVLWWDTAGNINLEEATKLHDLLKLQPAIISNNRLISARNGPALIGDTETPEQNIPATGYPGGRDWETCMTINDTWGYKSTDTNFKTTKVLLQNLIDIASKGGNYLLNVGPTAEGLIPQPEIDRLAEMGKWLAVNGEAIYGTGPNPFPASTPAAAPAAPPVVATASGPATTARGPARGRGAPAVWDWRATTKLNPDGSGKIYLHIFQWPATGTFAVPFIPNNAKITKAYLLADPKTPLKVDAFLDGKGSDNGIQLPKNAPDPIASVVVLEVKP